MDNDPAPETDKRPRTAHASKRDTAYTFTVLCTVTFVLVNVVMSSLGYHNTLLRLVRESRGRQPTGGGAQNPAFGAAVPSLRALQQMLSHCPADTHAAVTGWVKHMETADGTMPGLIAMTYIGGKDLILRNESQWALGVSAAHFRIPLVVVGQGKKFDHDGHQNIKNIEKVYGIREALRYFDGQQRIIFMDGTDTLFVNPVQHITDEYDKQKVDLLFQSECNSWPKCFREIYKAAGHECPSGVKTCFLNSGVFIGTVAALRKALFLLPSMDVQHGDDDQACPLSSPTPPQSLPLPQLRPIPSS